MGRAEDLLVLKAFADRPKDWVDVDGIIVRQTGRIDWAYVRDQLAPWRNSRRRLRSSTASTRGAQRSNAGRRPVAPYGSDSVTNAGHGMASTPGARARDGSPPRRGQWTTVMSGV